jgi:flagellar hook-basal body complex protein FliE
MPEYDAGTVKATMKADGSGLHAGVESAKRDYKSLKDVIVEALTQVKKSENEASKAKEEAALEGLGALFG